MDGLVDPKNFKVNFIPVDDVEVYFDEVEKLPEKWCVKRDIFNAEIINKWAGIQWGSEHYFNDYGYLHNDSNIYEGVCDGHTEISFETFKRLVLKQEEKPVELEVNKWYKYPDTSFLMCVRNYDHEDKSASGYGINSTGKWFGAVVDVEGLIPATDEEVKEALIKEAERRYKVGDKLSRFDGFYYGGTDDLFNNEYVYKGGEFACVTKNNYNQLLIKDGKWATIIKPEAIDFSKAGQLVKSKYDIVLTLPHKRDVEGTFTGIVVAETDLKESQIGYISDDWDVTQFTLCTEPVTLKNE